LIALFLCQSQLSFAQYHEVGPFLGASNYRGDVGPSYFLYPNSPAFGIVYKWNVTTRYSLRFSAINSTLIGSDYKANDLNRFSRAYRFKNNVSEVSAGVEINFVEFNLHTGTPDFSPYLFLGLSYVDYNLFYFNGPPPAEQIEYDGEQKVAIPIVVGFKTNPSPLVVLGFEVGLRYALTDNLDGSTPIEEFDFTRYGDFSNNDWYIFSGLTISFTFGDLPCYCKEKR
jgi:hypothetical protein